MWVIYLHKYLRYWIICSAVSVLAVGCRCGLGYQSVWVNAGFSKIELVVRVVILCSYVLIKKLRDSYQSELFFLLPIAVVQSLRLTSLPISKYCLLCMPAIITMSIIYPLLIYPLVFALIILTALYVFTSLLQKLLFDVLLIITLPPLADVQI